MLGQGLLVNFAAGNECIVDLFPQKVEGEHPECVPDFVESEEGDLGSAESFVEFWGWFKSKQSSEIVPVDVFLVHLLDLGENPVVFLRFLRIPEKSVDELFGSIRVQKTEGLVDNVRLCVFLLVYDTWFVFTDLYTKWLLLFFLLRKSFPALCRFFLLFYSPDDLPFVFWL